MLRYPDIYGPEYTTFCGCHVRRFALYIGYISIVLSVFNLIYLIIGGIWYDVFLTILWIFCCLCIVYADKEEKPNFYLPYLIITGLGLIAAPFVIIFCIVLLCADYNSIFKTSKDEATFRTIVVIYLVVYIFANMLALYFWIVVKRAKNYMETEVLTGNVLRQQRV